MKYGLMLTLNGKDVAGFEYFDAENHFEAIVLAKKFLIAHPIVVAASLFCKDAGFGAFQVMFN